MKAFENVNAYENSFNMDDVIPEFRAYAEKESDEIQWDDEQYAVSENMIKGRLKALIARNLWDYSAYFEVFNPMWPAYQTALEILEDDNYSEFNLAKSEF